MDGGKDLKEGVQIVTLSAYFQGSNIEGYIRYTIRDGTFTIQDFIVANLLAEQAMWRYMTSHAQVSVA